MIEILERANAADYVPTFARHRITIETMCQIDEEDLKQVTMTTSTESFIIVEKSINFWPL